MKIYLKNVRHVYSYFVKFEMNWFYIHVLMNFSIEVAVNCFNIFRSKRDLWLIWFCFLLDLKPCSDFIKLRSERGGGGAERWKLSGLISLFWLWKRLFLKIRNVYIYCRIYVVTIFRSNFSHSIVA